MADTPQARPLATSEQERHWLEENRAAIEAYNRRVAEYGLLSDEAGLLGIGVSNHVR
jgi:post-segregation antitoxin (ccd killing protein)